MECVSEIAFYRKKMLKVTVICAIALSWILSVAAAPLRCSAKFPRAKNASPIIRRWKNGNIVQYRCHKGYEETKKGNVFCINGKWKGNASICSARECIVPTLSNAEMQAAKPGKYFFNLETHQFERQVEYIKISPGTVLSNGSSVKLSCATDNLLNGQSGNSTWTSCFNGKWIPDALCLPDYYQCGSNTENLGHIDDLNRIMNGTKSLAIWPWMAALYLPEDKSKIIFTDLLCGGSIINRYFILTAAHCFYRERSQKIDEDDIKVKLGFLELNDAKYIQDFNVVSMFIHPGYRDGFSFDYDVALLLLDKPIEYNRFVRPICLPPKELPNDSLLYKPGEFAWVTGWGAEDMSLIPNKYHNPSKVLKELRIPLQSSEECFEILWQYPFHSLFTERMVCAGDGKEGNDACKGDSGSPLMQSWKNADGDKFWTQIGIVSWGIGCGLENTYGYYTHVQKLRSWIDFTVKGAMKNAMF